MFLDKLYERTMTTWLLMQWELLSTADHRYNRRTSIDVDLEEIKVRQWQRSNHNHLTIKLRGLSGDNDGRECERWKESKGDPIVIEKTMCFVTRLVL